jgi:hypothetical protein
MREKMSGEDEKSPVSLPATMEEKTRTIVILRLMKSANINVIIEE